MSENAKNIHEVIMINNCELSISCSGTVEKIDDTAIIVTIYIEMVREKKSGELTTFPLHFYKERIIGDVEEGWRAYRDAKSGIGDMFKRFAWDIDEGGVALPADAMVVRKPFQLMPNDIREAYHKEYIRKQQEKRQQRKG